MNTATGTRNARAFNSSIAHTLPADTLITLCGKDAKLMARWSDSDGNVDRRIWKRCAKCETARATTNGDTMIETPAPAPAKVCTCGAHYFSGCFCELTLGQFLASPGRRSAI